MLYDLADDGRQQFPQQPSAVPEGHDQRRDGRTADSVPQHGRFQSGIGEEGLRQRGRPLLVGHRHVQLLRHQQGSSAAQGHCHFYSWSFAKQAFVDIFNYLLCSCCKCECWQNQMSTAVNCKQTTAKL